MVVCEHGPYDRQTLRKCVSDDSQRFIFRRQTIFFDQIFAKISGVDFRGRFQKNEVLEGLRIFNPRWQMRRQKLLQVVCLFLGRLPWRRGKQPKPCFGPGLGTENDFNHLVL